jgi:hypothetical protein
VESMIEPLGFRIEMGEREGRRLITGAEIVQKCAVLPVSAMAGEVAEVEQDVRAGSEQGGPTVKGKADAEADKTGVRADETGTNTFLSAASEATIGFPLGHGPGAGGVPERGPRWAPRV